MPVVVFGLRSEIRFIFMFLKKLHILYSEYKNTSVLEGSSFKFFFSFWLTKIFSLLQHKNQTINNIVHKVVNKLPKPEFIIKNNSGIFSVQAFDDSTTICSNYFEETLRPWLDRTTHKDIFIDIGANRGIYTILAGTKYGFETIYAFEPNKEMYNVLKKNTKLNSLESRTRLYDVAIGSKTSNDRLSVDPMHKGGGKITTDNYKNNIVMDVKTVPLDSIIEPAELSKIGFIKIDTEGYEKEALSGMTTTLSSMPTGSCIMIETTEIETIKELLSPYGFTLTEISNYDYLFVK